MMRRGSAFAGLVSLGVILMGCSVHRASQEGLTKQAVGFNLTVEEAQNEMLLLNVVRAKDRLPMYLTSISSLNGNLSSTLTAGLGSSYQEVEGASGTAQAASGGSLPAAMSTLTDVMTRSITRGLTPSVGGTVARNPNFSLVVLDGEKFMRGFLTPIEASTFAFFWDQGWPPELLLHLLVQRVETPDGIYHNYPPDHGQATDFANWVVSFLATDPVIVHRRVEVDFGPPLSREEAADLGELVNAFDQGLLLRQVGDEWRLKRLSSELFLSGTSGIESERTEMSLRGSESQAQDGDGARLVLRSPEALLYFLGQLLRVAERDGGRTVPHLCIQEQVQPLFLAVPSGSCADVLVKARSPWGDYDIPPIAVDRAGVRPCTKEQHGMLTHLSAECDSGRSMQALRLLSQLISLQKSSEELPTPALVRVIGG